MKKTISQRFFLSLCLMIVGCLWGSAAWAAPGDVVYTLTCSKNSSNQDYATNYDVTINGLSWNAPGNQTLGNYWRIGGKSLNKVDRTITGKSPISSAISKVTLAHKGISNANAKINSVSLTVASDANFTNIIETVSISSPSVGGAGTIDFAPEKSGIWPKDSYYKLTINITNSKDKNYGLDITSLTFYEGAEAPAKTLSSVAVSGTPTKTTYEAGDAFDPAGLEVTGTYSDGSDAPITEGITWNVTPETLTAGLTSVDVTATVDGVTSEKHTVTGLTVTAARTLTSVTLEGNPTKTTYYVGETFDPTGIKVIANYTTGDPEDVTDEAIFTYDEAALTIGTTSVKVSATYNEVKSDDKNYDITVNKKASSISIANLTIGVEETSTITATTTPADAALTYTITDGNEYVTLDGNQITGSAVGTATIKASYAGDDEYEAAETSFTVTVSDLKTATISSFSTTSGNFTDNTDISFEAFKGGAGSEPFITKNNTLRLYQGSPGGYVTISGVSGVNIKSITLYTSSEYASTTVGYSVDGGAAPTSGKSVAENSSYTIDGLNNQSVSIYCLGTTKDTRLEIAKIVVKYTKENITLSSIALSGDYQTEFTQYDVFNHDNLTVTATYSNGSTRDVTSFANFTTPDMTTTGIKTVTVSYTENEVTKEATYDITVNKKIFSQIEPITAYRKITSTAEIVDGGQYVIVYTKGKKGLLAGASNIHNATPADVIFEGNGTISTANAAAMTEITFEKYSTNTYHLKIGDNKYIKATSSTSSKTDLNVATGKDEYTPWGIAFDAAGNVEITSKKIDNRGIMYSTNSTGYFKNYDVSKRGQADYPAIQLYQKVGEMPIAKATGYVSTYVADFAYVMPKHITGHTVALADKQDVIITEKVFRAGDEVPALTPLLIKSDEDYAETSKNYNPAVLNKTVEAYKGNNMLEYRRTAQGLTNTMKDENVYYYKLAIKNDKVGFYWGAADGAAFKMTKPSTAYLTVPVTTKVQGFVLNLEEGETTSIATVVTNEDAPIYNLQGIRMNGKNLPKGIYIQGGKKFMVK